MTPQGVTRLFLALAGLAGAAGVALAAAASHLAPEGSLRTAAEFLLFHAPAFLALAALSAGVGGPRRGLLIGGALLAAGLALFSGDLALRALKGMSLFRNAAPIGGTLMILGWLALGASALFGPKIGD